MNRRGFIAAGLGGVMAAAGIKVLNDKRSETQAMPALFIGHGSPMNAIENNSYTQTLTRLGAELPRPRAILVISAHWLTEGTKVLKAEKPRTIHDFYGFPDELFRVQYPAPGSPDYADRTAELLRAHDAETDSSWGLDHGTWSVLRHLFPKADIPVYQLSLNRNLELRDHLKLAEELKALRSEGVLIIGSGNITHNLRQVDFGPSPKPMAWAMEFDEMIKQALLDRNTSLLLAQDPKLHSLWRQAHPSIDHYLPLLYAVGVQGEKETPEFFADEIQAGSLSMRSVLYRAG